MSEIKLSLIAAMARNRVIGRDNAIKLFKLDL